MTEKAVPAFFKLDLSGFVSNQWHYAMPEKQSFDDCANQDFWTHVSDKVAGDNKAAPRGIGDTLVIFKRDAMALRRYMIAGIGAGFIRLVEIERAAVADVAPLREDSPLKTRWNPGKKCHEVVRIDGENLMSIMATNFQTKAEAMLWLNDHLQKMAA